MRAPLGRLVVVLLGVLAWLALAGPAAAHVGGGAAGSDFDGRVTAVQPAVPGVSVRVLQFGDEFELVNTTATEVTVPGYSDEPYLRIGPDGVWRNEHSPATYINLDRFGRVTLPAGADPAAEPEWVQVSTEPQYVWHDHRTHWMSEGQLPPAVAADPARAQTVFEWTVPMAHGTTPVTVRGVLTWSPPPAPALTWTLHLALLAAVAAAGLLARTPRALAVALAVGGAAALWHAASTPEPPATVSSHAAALASALLPALTAGAVAAGGVVAARRGRGVLTGLLAVVLGWLLLVQGLPDVDVLWSAHVLSGGPGWAARVAVGVLVAGGAGLVVGGLAATRRFRDPERTRPAPQPRPVG
ncbi:hypothetical protein SAMN05660690_1980 [Geodermatophilus telluris]|uniref:Uncharacterized protein n=1 Tax=Geodermatophilus telluris TaxID=1190417 RepID=A0A1G6MQH3_9ACTN|nr:hypothetical protein [Geodermatophilus telluris]SDC57803.1 hypothetical protein SAMN05660690_1980 [Geodermatophilus telluris]